MMLISFHCYVVDLDELLYFYFLSVVLILLLPLVLVDLILDLCNLLLHIVDVLLVVFYRNRGIFNHFLNEELAVTEDTYVASVRMPKVLLGKRSLFTLAVLATPLAAILTIWVLIGK